jgi:hypothetical protein
LAAWQKLIEELHQKSLCHGQIDKLFAARSTEKIPLLYKIKSPSGKFALDTSILCRRLTTLSKEYWLLTRQLIPVGSGISQIYKFLSVKINGIIPLLYKIKSPSGKFALDTSILCRRLRWVVVSFVVINLVYFGPVLKPEFQIDEEDTAFIYNNVQLCALKISVLITDYMFKVKYMYENSNFILYQRVINNVI